MNQNITYHLVPKKYYELQDSRVDYTPLNFAKEGFTHCTDGEFMVSGIAYNIYKGIDDSLLVLFLDKTKLKSMWRYDDPDELYPHVYGPINRDAIVKIIPMLKDKKGDWIFPMQDVL